MHLLLYGTNLLQNPCFLVSQQTTLGTGINVSATLVTTRMTAAVLLARGLMSTMLASSAFPASALAASARADAHADAADLL